MSTAVTPRVEIIAAQNIPEASLSEMSISGNIAAPREGYIRIINVDRHTVENNLGALRAYLEAHTNIVESRVTILLDRTGEPTAFFWRGCGNVEISATPMAGYSSKMIQDRVNSIARIIDAEKLTEAIAKLKARSKA